MKLSRERLAELRACLPPLSVSKIRMRLEQKGIIKSKQYFYRCLDPDHRNYNQDIIDEAIRFCIERIRASRERNKVLIQIIKNRS